MVSTKTLLNYLDDYLDVRKFRDYAPNGLQVEGREEIRHIITAVTASQAAIEFAIAEHADALLVHHGYFWKGEDSRICGTKRRRLAALLRHDINLIAYHLPLDQHPTLGNNVLLGQMLAARNIHQSNIEPFIWHGEVEPMDLHGLMLRLRTTLPTTTIHSVTATHEEVITHVAWCTGAAQGFLQQAAAEGAQVYISGEYAEKSYHEAIESRCHFIACGHHASERAGIRELGQHLTQTFSIECQFFDENNPF